MNQGDVMADDGDVCAYDVFGYVCKLQLDWAQWEAQMRPDHHQ